MHLSCLGPVHCVFTFGVFSGLTMRSGCRLMAARRQVFFCFLSSLRAYPHSPSAVATIADDRDILCLLIGRAIFPFIKNTNLYLKHFFQVHKGVHGFVKDKTGKPISKAVIVLNEGIKVHTKRRRLFPCTVSPRCP